jgi:putative ABC transport system permease protein
MGGAIGVLLGSAAALGIAWWAEWPVRLMPQSVVLAVGFSAGVGVFFGYYPARRASRLLPIEALRHE